MRYRKASRCKLIFTIYPEYICEATNAKKHDVVSPSLSLQRPWLWIHMRWGAQKQEKNHVLHSKLWVTLRALMPMLSLDVLSLSPVVLIIIALLFLNFKLKFEPDIVKYFILLSYSKRPAFQQSAVVIQAARISQCVVCVLPELRWVLRATLKLLKRTMTQLRCSFKSKMGKQFS